MIWSNIYGYSTFILYCILFLKFNDFCQIVYNEVQ